MTTLLHKTYKVEYVSFNIIWSESLLVSFKECANLPLNTRISTIKTSNAY